MAARQFYTTPGWGGNAAILVVSERIPVDAPLQYRVEEIASFALRFMPDTNEVVLLKGDEVVYSELLDI